VHDTFSDRVYSGRRKRRADSTRTTLSSIRPMHTGLDHEKENHKYQLKTPLKIFLRPLIIHAHSYKQISTAFMKNVCRTIWLLLLLAGVFSPTYASERANTFPSQPFNETIFAFGSGGIDHCVARSSNEGKSEKKKKQQRHFNQQGHSSCEQHTPSGELTPAVLPQTRRDLCLVTTISDEVLPVHSAVRGHTVPSPGAEYGASPPLLYLIHRVFLL